MQATGAIAGADYIKGEIVRINGNFKTLENLELNPTTPQLQEAATLFIAAFNEGLSVFDIADLVTAGHMVGVLAAASQQTLKAS